MRHISGTRDELLRILNEHHVRTGAEIGVADGKFSLALCQAMPQLELYCIDPWQVVSGNRRTRDSATYEKWYALASERLAPYHATLMRMTSREAAPLVRDDSLDFVFIDGNHDYEYVCEDITLWDAKVRSGGIVAGHDYYAFHKSGVMEAVTEYAARRGIEYTVIGEMCKHRDDNANPSWYWVKA